MSKDPVTITPEQDITDAMLKMGKFNVRRLPVVEDGKVVGILTIKDILGVQPELFQIIADKIELRRSNINLFTSLARGGHMPTLRQIHR